MDNNMSFFNSLRIRSRDPTEIAATLEAVKKISNENNPMLIEKTRKETILWTTLMKKEKQ